MAAIATAVPITAVPARPGAAAPPPTRSRAADGSAMSRLLLAVPAFAGSLLVMVMLAQLFGTVGTVLVLLWLASGSSSSCSRPRSACSPHPSCGCDRWCRTSGR